MNLRTDLLAHLTAADILKEAIASQHRYKAEPLFSKTGVGSLSRSSRKERAREEKRNAALIAELEKRGAAHEKKAHHKPFQSTKR